MKISVSRFLFPRLDVASFLKDSFRKEEILALVERGAGGFVLFEGSVEQCAETINILRSHASHQLLFACDCEFGLSMRFTGGTSFPTMMGLGYADDPELTYEVAAAIAREMKSIGIDWNFAPVLDINSNVENPIINIRSFGENAELVAEHGAAYIRGMQENGVIACGKHFPGHGDTSVDSHIGMPVLEAGEERLHQLELLPFRRAIDEGVGSIMSAHLSTPALDPSGLPASLSPMIIGYLRETLRYEGVVVTDALDMGAITRQYGTEEAVVRAFLAGNDVLEIPAYPQKALQALQHAADEGVISQEQIEHSGKRLETLLQWGEDEKRKEGHDREAHRILARTAAEASLQISKGNINGLSRSLPLLLLTDISEEEMEEWIALIGELEYTLLGSIPSFMEGEPELDIPESVLLVTSIKPRGGAGTVGLSEVHQKILGHINPAGSILLNLGNPYVLGNTPFALRVDTFAPSRTGLSTGLEYISGQLDNASDIS